MYRSVVYLLLISISITSCGGGAYDLPATDFASEPLATVGSTDSQSLIEQATPTALPTETFTPEATFTPSVTPTDTPLPTLELPTEIPNAPSLLPWDGTPTYLGDSQPGFDFRVYYDPDVWALTQDQFGYPAIGHRNISSCIISVTSGRGLPANVSVEQDILYVNNLTFYVNTGFEEGIRKFVTYTGSDGTVLTGFEVVFDEDVDTCLTDAVTVISSLRSVPSALATPEP